MTNKCRVCGQDRAQHLKVDCGREGCACHVYYSRRSGNIWRVCGLCSRHRTGAMVSPNPTRSGDQEAWRFLFASNCCIGRGQSDHLLIPSRDSVNLEGPLFLVTKAVLCKGTDLRWEFNHVHASQLCHERFQTTSSILFGL